MLKQIHWSLRAIDTLSMYPVAKTKSLFQVIFPVQAIHRESTSKSIQSGISNIFSSSYKLSFSFSVIRLFPATGQQRNDNRRRIASHQLHDFHNTPYFVYQSASLKISPTVGCGNTIFFHSEAVSLSSTAIPASVIISEAGLPSTCAPKTVLSSASNNLHIPLMPSFSATKRPE